MSAAIEHRLTKCPASTPPIRGTAGQCPTDGTGSGTETETVSLKTLADTALTRLRIGTESGTETGTRCPTDPPKKCPDPSALLDANPSPKIAKNQPVADTETPAERVARLDAERNEADRRNRRGYDYDGQPRAVIRISPHVSLGIVGDYGACDRCGEPAAMITPRRGRFCGIACYQSVVPLQATRKHDKRPNKAQVERIDELRRYLRQPLDADDFSRPYVTTGPYSPWPQAGFGRKGMHKEGVSND